MYKNLRILLNESARTAEITKEITSLIVEHFEANKVECSDELVESLYNITESMLRSVNESSSEEDIEAFYFNSLIAEGYKIDEGLFGNLWSGVKGAVAAYKSNRDTDKLRNTSRVGARTPWAREYLAQKSGGHVSTNSVRQPDKSTIGKTLVDIQKQTMAPPTKKPKARGKPKARRSGGRISLKKGGEASSGAGIAMARESFDLLDRYPNLSRLIG